MALHIELGKEGERIAENFLVNKGYQLVERNYRHKRGEIDLIVRNPNNNLIFVEVKTRVKNENPEQSVHARKQKLLFDTALHFKEMNQIEDETFFDIISINFTSKDKYEITHFEDIAYEFED